ncbi:MAG: aminotransferase class V-fold PLP-dependent enzyme, partial [Rhodospirillaceae bacterium]|nr:aminotransferase class V-fold PLP-dependent enzyme [Rhodospirillaceae bacterium]
MAQNATYLDYNSGAPPRAQMLSVMGQVLGREGNASSVHGSGRLARQSIETARCQVAALAGADPSAVVFTSGGTEANNTALANYAPSQVIVSQIEHDSVYRAVPGALEVAVTSQGRVDLDS